MEIRSFVRRNRTLWNELEELLRQFAHKPKTIGAPQIDRLTALYRIISSHLSLVRTETRGDETTVYLNQLVARAHHVLYQEQFRSSHQIRGFFRSYLPSLILKRQRFIGIAFLLFVVGALSGFLAVQADPVNVHAVLPGSIADNIDPQHVGAGAQEAPHALLSASIMTNNIRVAVLAFASGITLGLGTIYLMVYNGLIIGALAAVFVQAGRSYVFWAYILPHGVIELTAIFVAGGAGLYMGYSLLVPGRYPRRFVLLRNAKEAAQLLLGAVPLFVIAAIIEGYVTPSGLSLEIKYLVAITTLLLLAAAYIFCLLQRNNGADPGGYNASLDFTSK